MLIVVKILQYTYFTIFIFIFLFVYVLFYFIFGETIRIQLALHFILRISIFINLLHFFTNFLSSVLVDIKISKQLFFKCLEGIGVDFNVIDFYCKYMLPNIIRINFRMQIQISQKILYASKTSTMTNIKFLFRRQFLVKQKFYNLLSFFSKIL